MRTSRTHSSASVDTSTTAADSHSASPMPTAYALLRNIAKPTGAKANEPNQS